MGKTQATIQRAPHDREYVMIKNQALQDKRLSWKARGLLAYLLSLPDDWKVYITELAKHATDGGSSTRSGVDELIRAGYIRRTVNRDDKGKFSSWTYLVYESPQPVTDYPDMENPHVDNPDTENRPLQSTQEQNTHEPSTHRKDAQPVAETPEPPTEAQAMFKALAELCEWNSDMLTKPQRGQLNQNEKILRDKARASPDDLKAFQKWWYEYDWRGKKGDPPQPNLVRENWQRFDNWRKGLSHSNNGRKPDAATRQQRTMEAARRIIEREQAQQ